MAEDVKDVKVEEVKTTDLNEQTSVPDTSLIPNFPSDKEINKWKEDFGDLELATVGGEFYIYRRLYPAEQKDMQKNQQDLTGADNDILIKTLLVWPTHEDVNWEKRGAGTPATLEEAMLRFSGYTAPNPVKL